MAYTIPHNSGENLLRSKEPSDITEARELLSKFEQIQEHSERVHYFAEHPQQHAYMS